MALQWTKTVAAAAMLAALAACGGGGGGGPTEAVVANVSVPTILEGNAGTTQMQFVVTLDKPAINPLSVQYATASTAKAGGGTTGSATGGAACGAGVDYVNANGNLQITPTGTGGTITVTVCGDTVFEPLETVRLNWTLAGQTGSVIGTILNDDAGGLNGTGVAGSFGRDSQPLTNGNTDGRLGFSYTNVANTAPAGGNCIRDNVTGLLWEPLNAGGLHDAAATYTWANRVSHVTDVNAANTCGVTTWRVPTTEELASIVDNGKTPAPTVDPTFFATQASAAYWTNTTYLNGSNTDAWFVDFNSGTVSVANKTTANRLRLVADVVSNPVARASSCTDASRYTVHTDGTVTDNRTGLMWKQCAEGLSGAACSTGTALAANWDTAVARPGAASGSLGYTDWRLPTRAELSSITEREQCDAQGGNPSIVSSVFPNTGAVDYWTSTPYVFNNTLAWRVNFTDGEVGPASKTDNSKRVRLVRAGQ